MSCATTQQVLKSRRQYRVQRSSVLLGSRHPALYKIWPSVYLSFLSRSRYLDVQQFPKHSYDTETRITIALHPRVTSCYASPASPGFWVASNTISSASNSERPKCRASSHIFCHAFNVVSDSSSSPNSDLQAQRLAHQLVGSWLSHTENPGLNKIFMSDTVVLRLEPSANGEGSPLMLRCHL